MGDVIPFVRRREHPIIEDCILQMMREYGAPMTRDAYLTFAYGKNKPEWSPELEAELPEELQDWGQFERSKQA